jgi:hypothetical protein
VNRATRIGFLFVLPILAAVLAPLIEVQAQGLTFSTGEKLSHSLSVCLDKQDAIDILNAHKAGGKESAEKVWQEKDRCANGNVVGPNVGKVVYAVKIDGGVFSAVEILLNGDVVGYFLTSAPVNKPQRNS